MHVDTHIYVHRYARERESSRTRCEGAEERRDVSQGERNKRHRMKILNLLYLPPPKRTKREKVTRRRVDPMVRKAPKEHEETIQRYESLSLYLALASFERTQQRQQQQYQQQEHVVQSKYPPSSEEKKTEDNNEEVRFSLSLSRLVRAHTTATTTTKKQYSNSNNSNSNRNRVLRPSRRRK